MMSFGSSVSARATDARCRWPPDSWCGYFCRKFSGGVRSTFVSSSAARAAAAFAPLTTPCLSSGAVSVCWMVRVGFSEAYGSWWTYWTLRRKLPNSCRFIDQMSVPSKATCPSVGRARPAAIRAAVVLPEPLSPTRQSTSPGFTRQVDVVDRADRAAPWCRTPG